MVTPGPDEPRSWTADMEGASDGQREDGPLSRALLWKHTVYPFSEIKQARPFQVTTQDTRQTELENYSVSFPESPCWSPRPLPSPRTPGRFPLLPVFPLQSSGAASANPPAELGGAGELTLQGPLPVTGDPPRGSARLHGPSTWNLPEAARRPRQNCLES